MEDTFWKPGSRNKQLLAIIAPLGIMVMMVPLFQFLGNIYGKMGWYIGLFVNWLIWGTIFPFSMIGKRRILNLILPQKVTIRVFFLVLFPLLMAALYKLVPGMAYEKASIWTLLYLLSTAFGNGFFEEVLWRGVYMELFPDKMFFRIIWPSIWFGLGHYAPGSVSAGGNVLALMVGSGLFGFYLSFLAKKTDTLWWSIIAHTLGGMLMVI
jgi:membrane protease YdiL (CAAX protease family)